MTLATDAPKELCDRPQWVVWRLEERNDQATKVPYEAVDPHSRASSTNPDTWAAHGYAVAAVERGSAVGIGFVFSPDDPYCGVDIDHCVTDGHIDPHAMDIVRRLDSYTEISPSGTGLHIILRGEIGKGRKRTNTTPWGGGLESYDQARFFCVTGRHLPGTPTTIEERQAQLDEVRAEMLPLPPPDEAPRFTANGAGVSADDHELLRRARTAKNGARFDALYNGDLNGHGSASEADLALCNMLAFWTGPDPDRIDRLFRGSGLMRPKWDQALTDGTYGRVTIDKALSLRTEYFTERRGTPPGTPPRTEDADGREGAMRSSCDELAAWFGLDAIALEITNVVRYGRDSKSRLEVHISDGQTLVLDPLGAYSAASKLNFEIGIQIGSKPMIKPKDMGDVTQLIHTVAKVCDAVTLDERAADYGVSFLQEAKTLNVDMDDQHERWNAFFALAGKEPAAAAKTEGTSIAAQCVVLEDLKTGIRYVRASWLIAYVRGQGAPGLAEDVARRMRHLGWERPGHEGRIKATAPGNGPTLQWAFHAVPVGWENA